MHLPAPLKKNAGTATTYGANPAARLAFAQTQPPEPISSPKAKRRNNYMH